MKKLFLPLILIFILSACIEDNIDFNSRHIPGKNPDGSITPGSQADLHYNVGDTIYFPYDSSSLTEDSKELLSKQADWIKVNHSAIIIEGHCDERGTREYNLALGERRAHAVRNYFLSLGVSDKDINTISYGKERPAVLGSTPAAYNKNRRAVTTIAR